MGGKYTSNNVVMLTIEEHAEAHKLLFEQWGRWQDELAWKGLTGIIGHEEAQAFASAEWNRKNKTGKKRPDVSERTKGIERPEFSGENHPNFGKKNLEHSKRMSGEGNSMFGKKRPDLVERNKLGLNLGKHYDK